MFDRTAQLGGLTGTRGMFPRARLLCKRQARKRSRVAGRQQVFTDLWEHQEGIVEDARANALAERLQRAQEQVTTYLRLHAELHKLERQLEPEAFTYLFAIGVL